MFVFQRIKDAAEEEAEEPVGSALRALLVDCCLTCVWNTYRVAPPTMAPVGPIATSVLGSKVLGQVCGFHLIPAGAAVL